MVKTYTEFLVVVDAKLSMYEQIPDKHLSMEGRKAHGLYKDVKFLSCFASDATELLGMLHEEADVEAAKVFVGPEVRQIMRCLERLAAAESLPTT